MLRLRFFAALASALVLASCGGPRQRPGPLPRFTAPTRHAGEVGANDILFRAIALVGTPYRYGGNTPDSGFDCSGLVRYVVQRAASVNLPRTAAEMGRRGTSLDRRDVASGDLVFFNTTGQPNSHVGIYVGQNRFVHAPATGGTVRLEDMTKSYWASRYMGARRVVAVSNLPDMPAPTIAPTAPAPASPAHPIDDDPLGTLARSRDAQADSLMSTRAPAAAIPSADDDPIARFATQ